MTELTKILDERKSQHGPFDVHAHWSQTLKTVLWSCPRYMTELTQAQRESLEMIQHKIARILAGDPNHVDHWDDIAGYATLVANLLRKEKSE